ncbi:hypothetical protein D3C76_990520 [compost metagenome]
MLGQAGSRDDRPVGLGELVSRQVPGGDPSQGLAFGAMRLAGERRDFPDIQQHLFVRVIMADLDQRARRADHNTQFFLQLTGQGAFDRLVGLDLATGKLPQAALVLSVGTAGDEDLAAVITDDGGRYVYSFHRSISSRPAFCQALKAGHW